MRGRKPTPLAVKLATGNPGKRKIGREPNVVRVMPERPRDLTPAERRYWDDLAPKCFRIGTLTDSDGAALRRLCELSGLRDRIAKRHRAKVPEGADLRLYLQLTKEIRAHEDLFGLNAMARSRFANRPPGEDDPESEDDLD